MTVYIGETGRSGFERMQEHFHNFNAKVEPKTKENTEKFGEDKDDKDKGSMMWLHSRDFHQGTLSDDDWIAKITAKHKGALNRQVTEGIRITNEGVENLLNSKNEFGANNLTEVVLRHGNKIFTTETVLKHGNKILGDSKYRKRKADDIKIPDTENKSVNEETVSIVTQLTTDPPPTEKN